jgi:hypothetical protein
VLLIGLAHAGALSMRKSTGALSTVIEFDRIFRMVSCARDARECS